MTPCSPLPASTVRTEREESLTRGSFLLLPTPHCTPTLSCPPEMTFWSPCSACLSFPPPHAPNTQVDSKSQVWQSWDSYKRNAGNGLRRAGGGGGATGPCATHTGFSPLPTLCGDCGAESPPPNDSRSARSRRKTQKCTATAPQAYPSLRVTRWHAAGRRGRGGWVGEKGGGRGTASGRGSAALPPSRLF